MMNVQFVSTESTESSVSWKVVSLVREDVEERRGEERVKDMVRVRGVLRGVVWEEGDEKRRREGKGSVVFDKYKMFIWVLRMKEIYQYLVLPASSVWY